MEYFLKTIVICAIGGAAAVAFNLTAFQGLVIGAAFGALFGAAERP